MANGFEMTTVDGIRYRPEDVPQPAPKAKVKTEKPEAETVTTKVAQPANKARGAQAK